MGVRDLGHIYMGMHRLGEASAEAQDPPALRIGEIHISGVQFHHEDAGRPALRLRIVRVTRPQPAAFDDLLDTHAKCQISDFCQDEPHGALTPRG